jgi:hypothetical protein
MQNTSPDNLLVPEPALMSYQELVDTVTRFQDQLQSLDYRVTNKNFGSKIYQAKETISTKSRFIAGAEDNVVIIDAQNPTYRFWIGAADPTAAPFTVDKLGNVIASAITLENAIATGGTITGATVRTSASGGRVQLNGTTDALEVYDSAGTLRVVLDNDEISFYNDLAAKRGGIFANTTEVYMYALNGGNLQIAAEGALYTVLFTVNAVQKGYFSAAGLTLNDDLNLDSNDIIDLRRLNFVASTSNPSSDGQMRYYDSGGSEGLRMQFGGSDFQFDATAV